MQVSMVKTYACRNATNTSRAVSAIAISSGRGESAAKVPAPSSMTTKPPNTLSVMCPASMLANRRTEWLTGRDRNEITSISTTSGRIAMGTPSGTNSLRKRMPFLANPTTSTVKNTRAASAAVTMMWLVTVKKPGIMPSMLHVKINIKIVNTNGKYFIPALPVLSRSMSATNSCVTSAIDCMRPGTRERERIDTMKKAVIRTTDATMNSDEVVNETSQPNILIGTIGCSSNGWMGSGIPGP